MRAGRRPSPLVVGLAAGILVGAVAIGLARLPGELSDQSRTAAAARSVQRVGSIPVLSPGPRRTAFLAYVRRAVPPGESVRIVQPVTALFAARGPARRPARRLRLLGLPDHVLLARVRA